MSDYQDTETLKKIEQKLDKLEKKSVGKRFIIIVVAVISGLFTLLGVFFEAVLAPRTEHGIQLARIAASETGKFYVDVMNIVMVVDTAVEKVCNPGIDSQEGEMEKEISNALSVMYKIIRTPPSTTNELIVTLANDYNDYAAENIGVGITSNKENHCEKADQLTRDLRTAIDKEIRGFPFY